MERCEHCGEHIWDHLGDGDIRYCRLTEYEPEIERCYWCDENAERIQRGDKRRAIPGGMTICDVDSAFLHILPKCERGTDNP